MRKPAPETATIWIAVLLIGYVLSTGPAVCLFWHGWLPAEFVVIYKLLDPLRDAPVIGPLMCSYVDWRNPLHYPSSTP